MPDIVNTEQSNGKGTILSTDLLNNRNIDLARPMTGNEDQTSINSILPSSPISAASVFLSHVNVTACTTSDGLNTFSKPAESLQNMHTDNPFLDHKVTKNRGKSKTVVNTDKSPPPEVNVTQVTPLLLVPEQEEHNYRFEQETIIRYFYYFQKSVQLLFRLNILAIAASVYIVLFIMFTIRQLNPLREQS